MPTSLRWQAICIDTVDPAPLARWWAELLEWSISDEDEDEVELRPPTGEWPVLLFCRVPEAKATKNRLHLDLAPLEDQDAEVARAESLGARRIDIGQGSPSWVVLADPEGNEFCILRAREVNA